MATEEHRSIGIMHVRPEGRVQPGRPSDSTVWGWFLLINLVVLPRLCILGFWWFGSTLGKAFDQSWIPIVGFFVAPWTTVGYAFMWSISSDKVSGAEWIVVALCVGLDLWTYVAGKRLLRPS